MLNFNFSFQKYIDVSDFKFLVVIIKEVMTMENIV